MAAEPKEKKKYEFIFVLKLENNKWYIGHTNGPLYRIFKIIMGSCPLWIKEHRPVDIDLVCRGDAEEANRITAQYAWKYGLENVRSFEFNTPVLLEATMKRYAAMVDQYKFA